MKHDFLVLARTFSNSIKVGDSFYLEGRRNPSNLKADVVGTIEGVVAAHYIFGADNLVVLTSGAVIKLV